MVQKTADTGAKRRGRPRAYDPDEALAQAVEAFWRRGYSGTSLDDISAATGMNKPSLYAAFGDKREIYLKALEHYWGFGGEQLKDAFTVDRPLREALLRAYQNALSIYFPRAGRPRGCFAISTATTEALEEPKIRALLAEGLRLLDRALERCMRRAQERGELARDADPATLASLAAATMHSIAIRARAGAPRAELEALARAMVDMICGPEGRRR